MAKDAASNTRKTKRRVDREVIHALKGMGFPLGRADLLERCKNRGPSAPFSTSSGQCRIRITGSWPM
jgi:hypothetical protein